MAVAPLANGVGKRTVDCRGYGAGRTGARRLRHNARFVAANVSVRVTLFAADGPLFVTVMLYVEFCPSGTALTLVVTPMSAVLGLIETAPSDQFDVPLNVSEIGTLGAPVRLLPTPRTPGFVLFPRCTFHCETCGPGT